MNRGLLLLGKHEICDEVEKLFRAYFRDIQAQQFDFSVQTKNYYKVQAKEDYDFVICFLYPGILPACFLDQIDLCLNFHPGSRDYPGSGCYNFALYDQANEYGGVMHHMAPEVDTGGIIWEEVFKIRRDTILSLQTKTHAALFALALKFCETYVQNGAQYFHDHAQINWKKAPTTKRMLDKMAILDPETMDEQELKRRLKAFDHPKFPIQVKQKDGSLRDFDQTKDKSLFS